MKLKRTLLLLTLVLSILLSGCDYEAINNSSGNKPVDETTDPPQPTQTTKQAEPFIGFSETEVQSVDELLKLKPEELRNYTSVYSDYNTYTYFQYLNDTEKLVYRAYEYSLDEGLPYFWIDDRLLQGMERSTFQILEFFSLDSAVVEQNIDYVKGSCTESYTLLGVQHSGETYTTIYVEDFTKKRLKNKNNAILQAKIVLSRLYGHEAYSHRELAEYFYDYLGGCVGYEDDIEGEEYLYGALFDGTTNCDGYANAFALLCKLADIPCIEVNSDTPQGETGHTWNMVYLEHQWVHVDPTGAGEDLWSLCKTRKEQWVYFGFPDALLQERVLYADLLPSCPVGLTHVLRINSQRAEGFISKVKAEFESNDRKFAIVLLDQGDMDDQTIDELFVALNCDLYYLHYETADGRMVYYLFNDN